MIGWNVSYNWSYHQFKMAVADLDDKQYICLDVEHSDRKNMDDIILWAKELGYQADEVNCDLIKVYKVLEG